MRRRPVVVRRGPGVVGTVARTAVVAGTATVVAKGVSGAMDSSQQNAQQQAQANATTTQNQAEIEQMQSQMAAMQAQQAQAQMAAMQAQAAPAQQPAAAAGASDVTAKIQELANLKASGVLTDQEFAAAKAKLLGI